MCPILKVDPITGESLDKTKSPEQIAAEIAANERFYSERKQRIKTQKKRKKIEEIKEDLQVTINPFTASSADATVEELIEPFNRLLDPCEEYLKKITKNFKIKKVKDNNEYKLSLNRPKSSVKIIYDSDFTINEHIPKSIESVNNALTGIPTYLDLFQLQGYKSQYKKNIVIDRLWFTPTDIKHMLKHPKEAKQLLLKLISAMYNEMVVIKFLKTGNKYSGTTVASIAIPGEKNKYSINFKDEFLELRMWSDVTEIL